MASSSTRILLVDDDRTIRSPVRQLFESQGFTVREAEDVASARLAFDSFRPDAVLLDYELPDGTALDLIPIYRRLEPEVPILVLTGHNEIVLAVSAIKAGADQFLTKPIELPTLLEVVTRTLEDRRSLRRERAGERRGGRDELDPFLGTSRPTRALERAARIAAEAESPVLLQGETGSGKGVLARWLHANGARRREAFVDLNCAGLSRELLDSELFGYQRGAFTGAVQNKAGLFEIADRGTILLDEIGDIDPGVQPKILKVVEDQRFRRLGDTAERRVDVRLIAATHRDLGEAVRQGEFRADLYYRLNTLVLQLPPLRSRTEDLPELAEAILDRLRRDTGRSAKLAPEAVEALAAYPWPGNIRELRNVLERATLFARDGQITAATLDLAPAAAGAVAPSTGGDLTLAGVERRHIEQVLAMEHGQVDRAAERLGVPRSTLYQRLKEYGLSAAAFRS